MAKTSYAIAVGSNRSSRFGAPRATLEAAAAALGERTELGAQSSVHATRAIGPGGRSFANAALILATDLDPPEMLQELKGIERQFGRRGARRWGDRVLDLDIILWSEGTWEGDGLTLPHAAFRERRFVLDPLCEIAADWRDPITGATMRQLRARLAAPRPVDPAPTPS